MSKSASTSVKTLKLFGHYVWKYRLYAIGILIALPTSIFFEQYFNTIIIANVLNRLAKGQYDSHHIWSGFGGDIIAFIVSLIILEA
jgi:hypothetical protein